ncbi:hypothetical protein C4J81_07390 [Deltaproteobacteria bacterium Smac51]|nr:hypothetical protein C4J81_07390 [Deltaproteobacteria bacterium Smac51]
MNKNYSKLPVLVMAATALAYILSSIFAAETALAQTKEKARLSRELQRTMSRETPLAEEDYRTYMANLEAIFSLRQSPERASEVAAAIPGWSESRFAYVTTKMAVGMSMLLKPDDPRNAAAPDFAKPDTREMALIKRHKDELVKAVESLQAAQGN